MKHLLTALPCLLRCPRTAAEKLTVALDWTPNTNHVGLYVAQAKGWFTEAGLDVEILPYTDTSSGTLVATGVAQFGILSAVGFHSQRSMGADMTAVMAVVQHETGRLVFNGDREDIKRPADLDGLTYAGFGSAWENALISSIIRHDGGEGSFDTVTLGTSAYEALANGSVDFTLEVSTWEGVNSVLLGRPQRWFNYSDYGVPDQHTTFLGGNASWLADNPETAERLRPGRAARLCLRRGQSDRGSRYPGRRNGRHALQPEAGECLDGSSCRGRVPA
jgi:ABC-type nitrate/sulfonate/bicarbonate transport system substrate-binding protein